MLNNQTEALTYNELENLPSIERKEIWKIIDLDSLWEKTNESQETLEQYELQNKLSSNTLSNNLFPNPKTEFDRRSFL